MKPTELIAFLQECYRERQVMFDRHRAVAAHVSAYDANNTYQYVVNREETHLRWLADALADLDAPLPGPAPGPSITMGRGRDAWKALVEEDVRAGEAFLAKWTPRVEQVTNARNRTMLRLMLGEVEEQTGLFAQIAAGTADVLGRGGPRAGKRGAVAATRWVGD